MNEENPSDARVKDFPSERELREMLAASERRVEDDFKGKRKVATMLLIVPALIFAAWIAFFLISYEESNPPPKEKISLGAPAIPKVNLNPDGDPDLGHFLPSQAPAQPTGTTIDTSDVEFATHLLTFSHADAPQPTKK